MDPDLAEIHAVEETIRYVDKHGEAATYDDLVKHISWYWRDTENQKPFVTKGWMFDWIRCLVGE